MSALGLLTLGLTLGGRGRVVRQPDLGRVHPRRQGLDRQVGLGQAVVRVPVALLALGLLGRRDLAELLVGDVGLQLLADVLQLVLVDRVAQDAPRDLDLPLPLERGRRDGDQLDTNVSTVVSL
jgi:hypothetical protein